MSVFEANEQTLQAALDQNKPVVIQFWAEWCAPCRAMIPVVEQYAAEHDEEVTVARVDIDAQTALSIKYRVTAVPTFVVASGEHIIGSFTGAMPQRHFAEQVAKFISA